MKYLSRILRYPGGISPRGSNGAVVVIPDMPPIVEKHYSTKKGDDGEFKELTAEDYEQAADYIKERAEKQAAELISRSEQRSRELIEAAKAEAASIVMAARHEAEMVLTQAKATGEREGYEAAFLQQANEISECLTGAVAAIDDIRSMQAEYISACHDEVSRLAIEIAEEILQHDIAVDPLALYDMVERAVGSLKDAKWVSVSLSKRVVPLIELLLSELPAKCPTIGHIEITGKDMQDGSCIIDSADGLIDASVETQLRILERRFNQVRQKLKEG